jgi:hypothetical protein
MHAENHCEPDRVRPGDRMIPDLNTYSVFHLGDFPSWKNVVVRVMMERQIHPECPILILPDTDQGRTPMYRMEPAADTGTGDGVAEELAPGVTVGCAPCLPDRPAGNPGQHGQQELL